MRAFLRKASKDDVDLLYQWVNDEIVRVNSFSTGWISYEEHKKWYQELLADCNRQQYIYVYDEEEIGQVRLTMDGEKAEIGYSIQKEKRCMGHGKILLRLLIEEVKKKYPQIKKLVARVKPENIASQKVFLDLGFEEIAKEYEVLVDQANIEDTNYTLSGGGNLFNK